MNALGKCLQNTLRVFEHASWLERVALAFTAVAILTTSFDIACNLNVAGYSMRLTQLASIPVALLGMKAFFGGKRTWPVGGMWALIWVGMQLLLTLRSPSLVNGVGYWCWLVLDMLIVFGLPMLASTREKYERLVRLYCNSFFLIALVAIAQVALYALGISFFVVQTFSDILARANGFCYEPSYLATYLLMGLVLHSYLLEKEDYSLMSKVALVRNYVAILLAIAFSMSRMGYLAVGAWLIFRMVAMGLNAARQRKQGNAARLPLIFWISVATIGIAVVALLAMGITPANMARGTGLFGTGHRSLDERVDGYVACINVFLANPLVGFSLGGVDPALAAHTGAAYEAGNNGAAMSILGELLVANGIVGMVPFVAYIWTLFAGDAERRKSPKSERYRTLHRAMILALAAEFLILCFNQNILRPYLWMHIAFVGVSWKFFTTADEQSDGGEAA